MACAAMLETNEHREGFDLRGRFRRVCPPGDFLCGRSESGSCWIVGSSCVVAVVILIAVVRSQLRDRCADCPCNHDVDMSTLRGRGILNRGVSSVTGDKPSNAGEENSRGALLVLTTYMEHSPVLVPRQPLLGRGCLDLLQTRVPGTAWPYTAAPTPDLGCCCCCLRRAMRTMLTGSLLETGLSDSGL